MAIKLLKGQEIGGRRYAAHDIVTGLSPDKEAQLVAGGDAVGLAGDGGFVPSLIDADLRGVGIDPTSGQMRVDGLPIPVVQIVRLFEGRPPQASADTAGTLYLVPSAKGVQPVFCTGESLVQIAASVGTDNAWTPSDFAGLLEYWNAADVVGADGSVAPNWTGRIAGLTLEAPEAGKQPLLYTTTAARLINGHPVLNFDGVDDYMDVGGADLFATPAWTWLILCRPAPPGNVEGALMSSADTAGASTWCWCGYNGAATPAHAMVQRNAGDTEDYLTGPNVAAGTPTLIEWSGDGVQTRLRIKHAQQALVATTGANKGDGPSRTVGRDNWTLGCRKANGKNRQWAGDIAAIWVLSDISPEERGLFAAWLAGNYAVGV